MPRTTPGTCGDLAFAHAIIAVQIYGPTTGSRTVLYGLVDRTVTSMRIVWPTGMRRSVPIAPDGSYLAVFAGIRALRGATLNVARGRNLELHELVR
jgi:hypothetical protein